MYRIVSAAAVAVIVLLAGQQAFATENGGNGRPHHNVKVDVDTSAHARASAKSSANAGAIAKGGAADASGGGATVHGDKNEYTSIALGGLANIPGTICSVGRTGQVITPFGGIGYGDAVEDEECTRRANIETVKGLNRADVAWEMAKDLTGVSEALARMNGETATAAPLATAALQVSGVRQNGPIHMVRGSSTR